jgi:hypothetical protein
MSARPVTVLLPCHTFDDFPTWLSEQEAEELLAAWTAAWHPAVIAAAGQQPEWASVDLRPPEGDRIGIVPAFCDDRFSAQADADDGRWIRGLAELPAIAAAAADRLGVRPPTDGAALPGAAHADDFFALGLAALVAELLARRMRSEAALDATGFATAVVAAARAAVVGDAAAVEAGLREAFACLDATRARYYPVESWAVDVVLLAPTTLGVGLIAELESPVPLALVASGAVIRLLAERHPDSLAAVRAAVAAGRIEACGGRDDERPLDACTAEEIRDSFARGRAAWREHVGAAPSCFAAVGGGSSAILPQVLAGFGYSAAIWSLFDGTPLPDPGAGRIRWEGGGAGIEAVARPPLAADSCQSVLGLAEALGDALDHDHTAVIQFAHYAGTATRWHPLLRRIGQWCGLVGTFVTPTRLMERSAGTGLAASFEPDAFAPTSPPEDTSSDPIALAQTATRDEARRLLGTVTAVHDALPPAAATAGADGARAGQSGRRGWLPPGLLGRRRDDDSRALDNGLVRLVSHPRTGGILALKRPADRGNRLSQQLAVRTTAPPRPGHWLPAEDRGEWTRMEAESIDRSGPLAGGTLVSRGRLVDAAGRGAGRFEQRMSLVPGLPLAVLDLEIELDRTPSGPLWEAHLACRFAWHENEDVEVRRSLHVQSIATERSRFTAPHFIEVVPEASRTGPGGDAIAILTGGLPWHLRSSPHVVDCLLPTGSPRAATRLAVGIGLARPWEMALALAAGELPAVGPPLPENVRLTSGASTGGDRPGSLRLGILESAGRAGEVRIEFAHAFARAAVVDLEGRPRPDVHVAVDGRAVVLHLHRYQWVELVLDRAGELPDEAEGRGGSA